MTKVGIIVPVYNAGGRLRRLLNSLLAQTLQDINVICVLDAPNDGSDKVCYEYAMLDKRVVVFANSYNRGVSYSRNVGIKEAIKRGCEYITFADHDDFVEPLFYQVALLVCEGGGYDILRINSLIETNGNDIFEVKFNDPSWTGIVSSLLLPMDCKGNRNYLSRSVWNALYKTSFLVQHGLSFLDRDVFFEEDTLFNLCAYSYTKNVGYLNVAYYHWTKSSTSASEKVYDHNVVALKMLNFLEKEWEIIVHGSLFAFKNEYYKMVSVFLRRYSVIIQSQFSIIDIQRVSNLLCKIGFPICGRYENMKLFSRARIKLWILVLKLKTLSV